VLAPEYAHPVIGGTLRAPRASLAAQRTLAAYLVVSCALLGPAACNTYTADLLASAQGGASAGGGDQAAGSGGTLALGGAPSVGGSTVIAGAGAGAGVGAGGSSDAGNAGMGEGGDSGGSGGSSGLGGSSGTAGSGGASNSQAGTGGALGSTAGTSVGGAAAGTGGSGGTPGIELIDDFEDQNLVVLLLNGRNGPWYPINAGTKGGVQTMVIAVLTGTADARADSSSAAALHMKATGFASWGAGVGVDFVNTATGKMPYDVSAYKGISFYAKIGTGTQPGMKLLIPTIYSDPLGGKCNNTATAPAGTACNDHLLCAFNALKATWAVYECDFSNLMQQNFGLPQAKLDPTSVYGLQFTLATTALAADFWLDDVAFVLK
jgi:hypothetical protein